MTTEQRILQNGKFYYRYNITHAGLETGPVIVSSHGQCASKVGFYYKQLCLSVKEWTGCLVSTWQGDDARKHGGRLVPAETRPCMQIYVNANENFYICKGYGHSYGEWRFPAIQLFPLLHS